MILSISTGCIVSVVSSAVQSLGFTLQRYAHVLDEIVPPARSNSVSLWFLGVSLFVVANVVGSGIQIATLPLVILCPLQAVGLVFNSIYASLLLHEPFTAYSAVGTALVGIGAAFIAGLGAIQEPDRTLDELMHQLLGITFLSWLAITLVVAFCGLYLALHYSHEKERTAGVYYGIVSGILSAHSMLMAKSAVSLLLRVPSQGFQELKQISFWAIVLSFLLFAISQLYFANCGLKLCSSALLYPVVFCVFNLTSMVNGLLYFGSKQEMTLAQAFYVFLGTLILLSGVLCLSVRTDSRQFEDSDNHSLETDRAPAFTLRIPLLPRDSNQNLRYTSLDSVEPGIMNPDSYQHAWQGRRRRSTSHSKTRRVSKEQQQIFVELGSRSHG